MMMVDPSDDELNAPRRGRPRGKRGPIGCGPLKCYGPQCDIWDEKLRVLLRPDEIEILRLVDLEGLEQEEAAQKLGISRKTLWKDLHEARKKVTDALVNGKTIEISGCPRRNEGVCPRRDMTVCPKHDGGICPRGHTPADDEEYE
ncbi:DUF134 domain-containing protein [uncultured Methanospirillum sp.]|uniref:DUF134 domain-containing protein n=1 Tax=uncultured Methanospirillum sp. TaxID=262503 RepID=UPI0029C6B22C|nr:DUF134 domain-containing protein [uncultured Methanospirillum sp.]